MEQETYFLTGARHEYYIEVVLEEMKKLAPNAYRCFAGSEDGEAVVGTNEKDEIIYIVHFDPQERRMLDKAISEGKLMQYIIDSNK